MVKKSKKSSHKKEVDDSSNLSKNKTEKKVNSKDYDKTISKKKNSKKSKTKTQNNKNIIYILSAVIGVLFIVFIVLLFLNKGMLSSNISNGDDNLNQNNNLNKNANNLNSKQDDSKIIAVVNGRKITNAEFDKIFDLDMYFQGIPEQYSSQIPRDKILNQTIQEYLIYDKAKNTKYLVTYAEAEKELETTLINANKSVEAFKNSLNNKSFTYDDVINKFARQLTINKYINGTLFSNVTITEEDARSYYYNNTDKFVKPYMIRVSHILVNNSDLANKLISELNNGANFSELAMNYSIGPSGKNGGDLGYFPRGRMVPAFENAAFNLTNIGDYTKEPVKTKFGYHIILLTGKKDKEVIKFDEVKDKIIENLNIEKKSQILKDYLDKLFKEADIKLNS